MLPSEDDPRPIFQQIADDLIDQIKSGRLRKDSRMPSQKVLAKEYGVAINTVREALKVLSSQGLIRRETTRGSFVKDKPRDPEPSPEFLQMKEEMDDLRAQLGTIEDRLGALERRQQS